MSLNSLVEAASADGNLKFVFVGGKGGVGKTTSSSAIATLLATLCHKRVLLVSTDPAHSLGDAWRTGFSHLPKKMDLAATTSGSLDIMEVDPHESMQGELEMWAHVSHEVFGGADKEKDKENNKANEWESKITQFQEWLSGIPGIDEAMALSAAIRHIESGQYDMIVFDTAPTGHTLKLLALPDILEQGIEKLQSWQTTFWGVWDVLKSGGSGATKKAELKTQVKDKLEKYKHDIQKVACMLQDQQRTRFIVVCIAEFLSVSETQRLLQELVKNKVVASHIVVNQLVTKDALSTEELADLESLAEVGQLQLSQELLQKTVHACRLTTARKNIQTRYLNDLKGYPETQSILEGVCEVPLLAEEVTGTEAIQRFSKLLINDPNLAMNTDESATKATTTATASGGNLYDDEIASKNATYGPGDTVQITGLAKSPHFNNLQGTVKTHKNAETGRYGVAIEYQGKTKTLALHPQNILLVQSSEKKSRRNGSTPPSSKGVSSNDTNMDHNPLVDKAKKVLEDPEIKSLVEKNPKLKSAVEDCLANPMNAIQYLSDPEMSPFLAKIMAKM